jgi:hypothetical protein
MSNLTVFGAPRQKKNSGRVVFHGPRCPMCKRGTGHPRILPSLAWENWAKMAIPQISNGTVFPDEALNIRALFYRDSIRRVDACNLYEGLADVLEGGGIVRDDAQLVELDRDNPRVEVSLEPVR